jgi:hypothetical protein
MIDATSGAPGCQRIGLNRWQLAPLEHDPNCVVCPGLDLPSVHLRTRTTCRCLMEPVSRTPGALSLHSTRPAASQRAGPRMHEDMPQLRARIQSAWCPTAGSGDAVLLLRCGRRHPLRRAVRPGLRVHLALYCGNTRTDASPSPSADRQGPGNEGRRCKGNRPWPFGPPVTVR